MIYRLEYETGWDVHFNDLDHSVQIPIWKKINQLKTLQSARHLERGLPYFVVEVGQYRICFEQIDDIRTIVFVGNHKQYEKWYSSI